MKFVILSVFALMAMAVQFPVVSSCCYKINVSYVTGYKNRGAHVAMGKHMGYYFAQRGTYRGQMWYKSWDGRSALWYCHKNQWVVGSIKNAGKCNGFGYVNSRARCPHNLGYYWKYTRGFGIWYNAGKTLSVICKS